MAKSLLEKLNTLLQSNVRSLTPNLSFKRLGKGVEDELQHLHQQIKAALQDETTLEQQIAALEAEILAWDQQADAALAAHQEAQARYAIEQMELVKRRLAMRQSELGDHRGAVYALMQQVNQLEALVKVAKQSDDSATPDQTTQATEPTLSEAIRAAREAIQTGEAHGEVIRVKLDEQLSVESEVDEQSIEQDITARRSRLAKPD